jgi:citrate synthase
MSKASGLEGVVVAETKLSSVDGERGRLVIAGQDVETLAARATFEEVAALLLGAPLSLGPTRARAFERIGGLGDALDRTDGMDALRAAVAHLPGDAPAADVVAAPAVFVAAWARRRAGHGPVAPDPARGHAEDFLAMVKGAPPRHAERAALDAYFVTVVDHGMNASTFAARVVASTRSDLVSAVVAAIGALKGPLHGGAPGPVLEMLDAIGTPDRARAWLDRELARGRRIMGMGHRVYRVRDPRAAVLERAVESLARAGVAAPRLALARAVEREAVTLLAERHPDRALRANVEWYTSVLLGALGLPPALFTPTFAVSRVLGWTAHVAEERALGRLIRPASRYVGPLPPNEPGVPSEA